MYKCCKKNQNVTEKKNGTDRLAQHKVATDI